jgi:hypothetical protein
MLLMASELTRHETRSGRALNHRLNHFCLAKRGVIC